MRINRQRIIDSLHWIFQALLLFTIIVLPFSKPGGKFCIMLLLVVWTMIQVCSHGKRFFRHLIPHSFLDYPILSLAVAVVLATHFSVESYVSQQIYFQRYVPYFIVFFLGLAGGSMLLRRQPRALVLVFVLTGLGIGAGGICDYLMFRPYRLFSVFGKGLYFDAFLMYFFTISLAQAFFSKQRLLRAVSSLTVFSLVPVLVWHSSRLLWLTVGLITVFFTLFTAKKTQVIVFIGMLAAVGLLIMPVSQRDRAKSLGSLFKPDTYSDRLYMVKYAFKLGAHRPFTGVGPGMFEYLYRPPAGHEHEKSFQHSHAHNAYLEVFAETGLLGLLSFLSIFFVFIIRAWAGSSSLNPERRPVYLGLFGAVCAVLFTCLGGSFIIVGAQDAFMFWLVLGIAVAAVQEQSVRKEPVNG